MPALLEVPLTGKNQTVTVSFLGVSYQLTVQWRNAAATWFLDIADGNGVPLLAGIAMVTGANLLHQYQSLGIAGAGGLFMLCDPGIDAPTFANLGTDTHLVFLSMP